MARKRPTVLTVMGILNIVFGSLFLFCNLCNGIGYVFLFAGPGLGAFQGKDNPFGELKELMDFWQNQVPGFAAVKVTEVVVGLVANTALLLGGIGLLKVKNWGRVLSILYSILEILVKVGSLIYTFTILNPATKRFLEGKARGAGRPQPGESLAEDIATIAVTGVLLAYALVLLIMMLLPSVSAAMAASTTTGDYEMDRQEDEDEYLERERRYREDKPE
jgi:hypothetical protein